MTTQRKRPGMARRAEGHLVGRQVEFATANYSKIGPRRQPSFQAWCASDASWGQTRGLDPEILKWLFSLTTKPEAVGIDGVTLWMQWMRTHRTKLRWDTKLEWQRVELSARAIWKAYQDYLKEVGR